MTYQQQFDSALAQLNQATDKESRLEFFRKIQARQQLDTIAIALSSNIATTN
jgi:hypothetical protein